MKKDIEIRKGLTRYSRKIAGRHLVMGAMGNISVLDRGEVWIKRKGAWMEKAVPGDFIKAGHGNKGVVSKEINLHLGCYKVRADVRAVMHTHPCVITAIGTVLAGKKRLFHFSDIEKVKSESRNDKGIAIIRYYQPGSKALAKAVSKAIKNADSVVMADHGLVVVGKTLKEAYEGTLEIESKARKFLRLVLQKLRCFLKSSA